MPELPVFDDTKDNIDNYLGRFERFAKIQKWETTHYATVLSALLTGRALTTYARLSSEDAADYIKIKQALLKTYNHTEEGFREKFRNSKPKDNESPGQFMTRIEIYCNRWLETAGVSTYDAMKHLIVKEQFLNMCPQSLSVHLKERPYVDLTDMCAQADRYVEAHKQKMVNIPRKIDEYNKDMENSMVEQRNKKDCYNCGKLGHVRAACRNEVGGNEQKCYNCNRYGHLEETCRNKKEFAGFMRKRSINTRKQHDKKIQHNTDNAGKMQSKEHTYTKNRPKTVKGKINNQVVDTLRDTGCSTICVKRRLVLPEQLTGQYKKCELIDGTGRLFETAIVNIDTPYIKGNQVQALCIENPEYDLIIGDVLGARCPCNPNPDWKLDNHQKNTDKYKSTIRREPTVDKHLYHYAELMNEYNY